MCRFVMYLGPPITLDQLVTRPENSLIHQSFESQEREEPLNGDGFGVAWYVHDVGPEPAVFRSISPAWSNHNLHELARVTRSPCVLAHVRAATSGLSVSELNCHPFTAGRFAFMHNGDVGGFRHIRRQLLAGLSDGAFHAIRGSTDSEHLFAMFLDRAAGHMGEPDPALALARALYRTIRDVIAVAPEPCYLNLAVSDGVHAAAARFTTDTPDAADSLYWHSGKRYVCEGDVCRMVEPEVGHGTVLISSEPLSGDPGWERVPVNHLVVVQADRTARVLTPAELG